MKNKTPFRLIITTLVCLSLVPLEAAAETGSVPVGEKIVKEVGSAIGSSVAALGKTIQAGTNSLTNAKTGEETKKEINRIANKTLDKLVSNSSSARILNKEALGYAVFDSRKISLFLTSGFGMGVVVNRETTERTYMHMATGGVGLGAGGQFFQLVFFFENSDSINNFISRGLEANAAATAVFGKNSLEGNARFVEGLAVYQINEAGIIADLNITGTKYWKSEELNSP